MAVLILNTDDTALHTVSLQHAIGMLVRKVAVVEAAHPDLSFGSLPQPEVLRLVRYVKTAFLYSRVPGWTKRGVLKRDRHSCGYCGEKATTVDHIQPISRGGRNSVPSLQRAQGQPHTQRSRDAAAGEGLCPQPVATDDCRAHTRRTGRLTRQGRLTHTRRPQGWLST